MSLLLGALKRVSPAGRATRARREALLRRAGRLPRRPPGRPRRLLRVVRDVAGRVVERIPVSPGRVPGARRRARGITGAELRGFKKVARLLGDFGMVPRRLRGARPMRKRRR